MARSLLLFVLCALPVLSSAWRKGNPFLIKGRVYCDTCRCGFETRKTTYIPGARVRIECRDRTSAELKYRSAGNVTDGSGTYHIVVEGDQEDRICHTVLVSSPLHDCKVADPGRNRAQVILTRSNGAVSDLHFANAMGFFKDKALPGCDKLLKELLQDV
ncbi:hypothetical protein Tsubulata_038324 [Turnera subulata]|uniref:Uncharacterized protein n=1 Tax=Turnera subulata TaxID=218843 RepID=A0A9Q0JCZ3_9ROSI|nr:hypothetical protein Tsubulata_038324 [Turnera subulata]